MLVVLVIQDLRESDYFSHRSHTDYVISAVLLAHKNYLDMFMKLLRDPAAFAFREARCPGSQSQITINLSVTKFFKDSEIYGPAKKH